VSIGPYHARPRALENPSFVDMDMPAALRALSFSFPLKLHCMSPKDVIQRTPTVKLHPIFTRTNRMSYWRTRSCILEGVETACNEMCGVWRTYL
jgi:hypothetical protein